MDKSKHQHFSLAFVTGASSGIGGALCRLLAKKGVPLMITGRDAAKLNAVTTELKPFVDIISFTADLAVAKERSRLIDKLYEYQPDLIINNAGFGLYGEALTYKTEEQLEIVNVNATAVLELTLEGARMLVTAGKKGVILNVSSAAAMQIFPCMAVYSASKAFVNQVSESLDYEMRPYGIRVLAACPGMVSTEFSTRAAGGKKEPINEKTPVMSPEFAAEQLWWQITKQKPLYIFDWKVRLSTFFSRILLPKSLVARFLTKIIKARHPPRPIIVHRGKNNKSMETITKTSA